MRGRRRCAECGEAAPASARFCGRCGGLIDTGSRRRVPADEPAAAQTGDGTTTARRGRWLAVVVLVGIAVVAGAILADDRLAEQSADDEVALPDEEELEEEGTEEQEPTTPSSSPSGMPDPDDVELTCLVTEPCERWRVDVGWLARDDAFMPVQSMTDGGYVLHGPAGVVVLDRAGRERWRRTVDDVPTLDRALAVGDDVLAMTSDGALRLLDGTDGSTRWRQGEAEVAGDEAQVVGGESQEEVVLLQFADTSAVSGDRWRETVEARDRRDGTRLWRRSELEGALIVDGRALVLDGDRLSGLDAASGERSWVVELPVGDWDAETGPGAHPHLVRPAFDGERVTAVAGASVAGSPPTTLLLDPTTGRRVAELEGRPLAVGRGPGDLPLVLDRTAVRSGIGVPRHLVAVDAEGEVVWERELERPELEGGRPTRRQMSAHGELLLHSSGWQHGEHVVQLVDLATGRLVHDGPWQLDEPVRPLGGGVVEVARDDAQLAVAVEDGTELWRIDGGPLPLWGPGSEMLVRVGDDLVALHTDPRDVGLRRPGGREALRP